jgi:ribosome maturation factor RimP
MQGSFLSELRKLAEEVSAREGCYLYDLEMIGAGNARVLRVTIDKDPTSTSNPTASPTLNSIDDLSDEVEDDVIFDPGPGGAGGVSVQDCTNVSRAINLRLDVEDIIPGGPYQLEVSSPGLERVLKEQRHYQGALGKQISVKSFAPLAQFNSDLPIELAKAKQIQGPLLSYDDKGIKVGYLPAVKKGADALPQIGVFAPYESITKANVVFVFEEKGKPGQKVARKPHPMAAKKAGLAK